MLSQKALDLNVRLWERKRGNVLAIGTYIDLNDESGMLVPCMVLIRHGEEYNEHTQPCVVTYTNSWRWSEDIGDKEYAMRTAMSFCNSLRLGGGQEVIFGLLGLIHDCLQDLNNIPPRLRDAPTPVAELTRVNKNTGETVEVLL